MSTAVKENKPIPDTRVVITNAYRRLVAVHAVRRVKELGVYITPRNSGIATKIDWGMNWESACKTLIHSKKQTKMSAMSRLVRLAKTVGVSEEQVVDALNIRQADDETSPFKTLRSLVKWAGAADRRGWKLDDEKMQLNEIDRQLLLDSGYELEDLPTQPVTKAPAGGTTDQRNEQARREFAQLLPYFNSRYGAKTLDQQGDAWDVSVNAIARWKKGQASSATMLRAAVAVLRTVKRELEHADQRPAPAEIETGEQSLKQRLERLEQTNQLMAETIAGVKAELHKSIMEVCG